MHGMVIHDGCIQSGIEISAKSRMLTTTVEIWQEDDKFALWTRPKVSRGAGIRC